jgi:hypothetical protein
MTRRISAPPALATAAILAGCVSGQDATNGSIRFMNAVPDSPRMSLYINDNVRAANYDFSMGSPYIALGARTYDVTINQLLPDTDQDTDDDPDLRPVFDESLAVGVNAETTLVVVGQYGAEEVVQIPTRTTAVPIGQTRLQFVHAAAGAPALDAYVTAPDAPIDVNTEPFVAGLAYKATTPQQDITGGSLRVALTAPGTPGTILFDSGTLFFTPEGTLLIAVVPNVGPDAATRPYALVIMTGSGATTVNDEDLTTSVRFVNASPGTYTLDAFVNDTEVDNTARQTCDPLTNEENTLEEICAMPFEYVGPFLSLEPATYDIKVQRTDDADLPARTNTGTFVANAQATLIYTGLIADTATDTAVGLNTVTGTRRVAPFAQLRIVNGSVAAANLVSGDPTTDRIELYITEVGAPLADEDPDFAGLRVGSDTGYLSQAVGQHQLTVAESDTATPEVPPTVLLTQTVDFAAGGIYTLVIVDSVGGVTPLSFLSLDDDP